MASKWTDCAAQLRRLWRLPVDVAQAGQASAHAKQTIVAGLAGVAARLESLQTPDGGLAEIPALRCVLTAQSMELAGLRTLHRPLPFAPDNFVRGARNPRSNDWDARWEPSTGFHPTLETAP